MRQRVYGVVRKQLVMKRKREKYEKETSNTKLGIEFNTEAEVDAFVQGVEAGRNAFDSNFELEILAPVRGRDRWIVYYKVK